jgi:hypothetical protein
VITITLASTTIFALSSILHAAAIGVGGRVFVATVVGVTVGDGVEVRTESESATNARSAGSASALYDSTTDVKSAIAAA